MTRSECWQEWVTRCALDLCSDGTQSELRAFAHSRFAKFAAAYSGASSAGGHAHFLTPSAAESWHLFESHLRLRHTRQGKSYKQWLLARSEDPGHPDLDCIQSGATLILRDAVRERIRREFSPRWMESLQRPADSGGASIEDLLPSPLDTRTAVEQRELESQACRDAPLIFASLSHRQRVALLARERGFSLASPQAVRAAGCGKSTLFSSLRQALHSIAAQVRLYHPDDEPSLIAERAVLTYDRVKQQAVGWGRLENRLAAFFHSIEGDASQDANNREEVPHVQDHCAAPPAGTLALRMGD